ncbi:heavy-metal-associated domain-containing protein [Dethiobacter alkaliphilus]|uniref:Copper chaperone CopZ n=1 Tax=Dethiobacter alkaliphilus AHT 1 TaxID=555088 RepID=C0GHC5_DETAL|nr:copper ion binding protein [Dethiobacter alkaliphilus]EEG77131.1 copper ion binding protein [Dethiobacter alkaliphilus AHT 1]
MSDKLTLNIGGMTCNHCKMKVEKALKTLDGVQDVQINLEAGQADVSYDGSKISESDLKAVVGDAGYEVK